MIYSNSAGVTFSHNPLKMPPVSGDRSVKEVVGGGGVGGIYCHSFVEYETAEKSCILTFLPTLYLICYAEYVHLHVAALSSVGLHVKGLMDANR